MCGIVGFITTKEHSRFAQHKMTMLLLASQERGDDATGISFNTQKDHYVVFKRPDNAHKFVSSPSYQKIVSEYDPVIAIGHTRAVTQGLASNNDNNHPVIAKRTGLQVVHNGMISNDDEIFTDFKLERTAQVDSEVIVKMLEHYKRRKFATTKAIQLTTQKVRGSMAIAVLNPKEPKTIYITASSNPICLAYHKPTGTVFFASTQEILENALADHKVYFKGLFKEQAGLEDYLFEDVPDDNGYKITYHGATPFEVERPKWQTGYQYSGNQNNFREKDFQSRQTSLPSGPVEKVKEVNTPKAGQNKPTEYEKDDKRLMEVLQDYDEFDAANEIKKPSLYPSELLLWRLEWLQDLSVSNQMIFFLDKKYTIDKAEKEVKRLLDSLRDRQKITKRDIYIPKQEEILTKPLTKAQRRAFKYVLFDRNEHLLANLGKQSKNEVESARSLDDK